MIPFMDFGGSGPPLHFAHANGYPPAAYTPLIETLTPGYHVFSMLMRPLWPGCSPDGLKDWSPLVEDLLRFLDERGGQSVIGVGHSLGAVVTLAAALRRPQLFRAIALLDPVLFHPNQLRAWGLVKKLGLNYRAPPFISAARRRRRVFENAEEMYARYRRAPVFSRIDDHGLHAYVEALARPRPDGQVELAYSPEWEAAIYAAGPLDLWRQLPALRPPTLVVWGSQSDAFRPGALRKLRQAQPNAAYHAVEDAGHLVPMEKPGEVGEVIRAYLKHFPDMSTGSATNDMTSHEPFP